MKVLARLLAALLVSTCLSLVLRAELSLKVTRGDQPVSPDELSSLKGAVKGLSFELGGEPRDLDPLAYWWPHYSIEGSDAEQLEEKPGVAARGEVALRFFAVKDFKGKSKPSEVEALWPGASLEESLVLCAWIVDGKPARVVPLSPLAGGYHLGASIELDASTMQGHPALLLWTRGRFVRAGLISVVPVQYAAFRAAVKNDAARLAREIDAGLNPDAIDLESYSLSEYAAQSGALSCLKVLKARKVTFNARPGSPRSPLELAAEQGRLETVLFLLASGISANGRGQEGDSPLFLAATNGHVPVVEALLQAGANQMEITSGHLTAMHGALRSGRVEVVRTLQSYGASLNLTTPDSALAFQRHCAEGHIGMVRFFLENGAVAKQEADGRLPLVEGARKGTPALAELLLREGASLEAVDAGGYGPLLMACITGNEPYARALLAAGAKADVQHPIGGDTVLHSAVLWRRAGWVSELLAAGAEAEPRNKRGMTALDMAVLIGAWDCAEVLMKAGGRLDPRSPLLPALLGSILRADRSELLADLLRDGLPATHSGAGGWSLRRLAHHAKAARCEARLDEAGAKLDLLHPATLVQGSPDAGFKYLSGSDPVDPRPEQLAEKEGILKLRLLVGPDGRVGFAQVEDGVDPLLCLALADAVDSWRFSPPTEKGRPVAAWVSHELSFPSAKVRAASAPVPDVMPRVQKRVAPEYPKEELRKGGTGRVDVVFTVSEKGEVINVRVQSTTNPAFDAAALACVRKWKFAPAKYKGKPVPFELLAPVVFMVKD